MRFALPLVLLVPSLSLAADPGLELFENKIRPVLVKHCYECHSTEGKKTKGGLIVDSREGLLKGGDSGPALVPGKVNESLLIKALRHDGVEMPPSGKLSDEIVNDFARWVRIGAPDPRKAASPAVKAMGMSVEEGRKFWSFRLPQKTAVPAVGDAKWPSGDIDRFILAAFEAKSVKPSADTDARTLIRRMTFDLIGLPPTPDEVDAFVKEHSSSPKQAIEKAIDRLLASPHFGERWGRHWLDVARYADSNGRDENLTFHEAYLYRDYVIDSLNRDKPVDRFIREQIAGDLMDAADQHQRDEQTTGSGFLILGPKVLADRDKVRRRMDVVDEQIDTVGKAFMGLTLGCARCHDHKFDPVPTADYYALAGIFLSTRTLDSFKAGNPVISGWSLRTLGGPDSEKQQVAQKEHQARLKATADAIKKLQEELKGQENVASMRVPNKLAGITLDNTEAEYVGTWKSSVFTKPYVGADYVHDDKSGKGEKSATFTPVLLKGGEYEVLISYTAVKGRATNIPVTIRSMTGDKTVEISQEETPKIDGLFRSLGKFKFEAGDKGSVTISNKGTVGHVLVDAVRFVPVGKLDENEMAMGVPEEVRKSINDIQGKLKKLEAEEAAMKKAAPPAPRLAMAPRDEDKIVNTAINIRGNPNQLGSDVPRGVLQVALYEQPAAIPANQSGRLQLADWIASPKNPLTARVYVNRVWDHLFGSGLVRTVDNFGIQGERPTNQALLDTLAIGFMEDGWSTKRLIRRIMLSRTYQLSSANNDALAKADPENLLFGKANRRRAEAEYIRDSVLNLAGTLDRKPGGSSVALLGERAIDNNSSGGVNTDSSTRRAVYLPIIRNEVPQLFEVFDFADADVSTGKREATTVPTQALYLMNSPFAMAQSREAAKRLLTFKDEESRVTDLYRRAFGRPPSDREKSAVLHYVAKFQKDAKSKEPELDAWAGVCRSVFGSTEFRFVE